MPPSHGGGWGFKSPSVHHIELLDPVLRTTGEKMHEETYSPTARRGIGQKYIHLLDDKELRNWYDNLLQGSGITAKKYLRRSPGRFFEWVLELRNEVPSSGTSSKQQRTSPPLCWIGGLST